MDPLLLSPNSGKLLVVEGIDGSGKSSIVKSLEKTLQSLLGPDQVKALREPGGTPLGEKIRALLLDEAQSVTLLTEALLFFACRAQLLETQILPYLQQGVWVILDRFQLSSLAYQGAGRQTPFGILEALAGLMPQVRPHLTFYLSIPLDLSFQRQAQRRQLQSKDRVEQLPVEFWQRVHHHYEQTAQQASNEKNWATIDARPKFSQVQAACLSALFRRFPELESRHRALKEEAP